MAIEIVDFPIKNGGSFHCYVAVHQRVTTDFSRSMDSDLWNCSKLETMINHAVCPQIEEIAWGNPCKSSGKNWQLPITFLYPLVGLMSGRSTSASSGIWRDDVEKPHGMSEPLYNLYMGVSENSVPLNPMVLLIIIPIKWLFHWEY